MGKFGKGVEFCRISEIQFWTFKFEMSLRHANGNIKWKLAMI